MTESPAMADNNERPATTNHQTKKKKPDDQPPPPDMGLKPVQLQRRRVWRACESCRRKKIKCDGVEPTCSQCASSKSQCTWLQTKDRAALSRHYVQELEARLLHMETLFQHVAPILEQVGQAGNLDLANLTAGMGPTGPAPPPPNPLPTALSNNGDISAERRTDSASPNPIKTEDDMSESFGQLALDEHGQMRWIGSSSTMSLIQSFRTLTSSPLHRVSPMEEDPLAPGPSVNKLYFPASVFFGKVRVLPGPEEVEYPPRDLADKLVEAYFARFHFLMPIIDKPSFLKQYQWLMDHTDDVSLARNQTPFLALVHALFACAAKMVDDPRLSTGDSLDDGGMGMVYYERALILQYISHTSMQVEHVQCFLLMSTFLCSVNCLPQAWILVGQAVRIAQDLGLHRSPRRLLIGGIEKETRRKVWWGCYMLDRMLALALGRPLGIADSDCDVEMPVDIDDESLPEYFAGATMNRNSPFLMRGFIELISLYKIAGQVLREVYSLDRCKEYLEPQKRNELNAAVETLDKTLTQWCEDLPKVFKSNAVTDKQVSMAAVLCTHYYSILTTLHRNFLPVKSDQIIPTRSTAKAVSTARACIRLAPSIKNVVPLSHHLAFFIQTLFSSAVIILLYAMHITDPGAAQSAMEEAKSCLGVIESWEGYWPGAKKCRELLEDLTGTANEAIKALANGQTRGGVSVASASGSQSSMQPNTGSPSNEHRVPPPITVPPMERGPLRTTKPSRNRSRDVRLSPRMVPSTGYHRHDPLSQRARSTSRKRPHAEDFEIGPSLAGVLSGSYPGRSNLSNHSSPISINSHPSPPSRLETTLENSPVNSFNMNMPPQSPTVPVSSASSRFPYDFNASQSPPDNRWAGPSDPGVSSMYDPTTQQAGSPSFNNSFMMQQQPSLESSYLPFDGPDINMSMQPLPANAPSSGFSGPGLPFRGLDYIRNYNPGGYMMGTDQEGLWQTFDPGAFGLDPELPFTLGDIPESQDGNGQRWEAQS